METSVWQPAWSVRGRLRGGEGSLVPKVMVVDDEESLLEAIRYALSREGMEVVTAADGTQAVRDFERERPDLLVLVARVRALLRRAGQAQAPTDASVIEAAGIRLDQERHEVTVRGDAVSLPLKEFELLEILMENRNRVLTRQTLIDRVWGFDYVGDTKTLDVHVKRLRARLEQDRHDPKLIVTVRGVGYRFDG